MKAPWNKAMTKLIVLLMGSEATTMSITLIICREVSFSLKNFGKRTPHILLTKTSW